MNLKVSYYPTDDMLLLENGKQWRDGSSIAENVVVYSDSESKPAAIEVSGAAKLLRPILNAGELRVMPRNCGSSVDRPDEDDLDRVNLALTVSYDREVDILTLECGLPTPFDIAIADGLTVFYDGEDEYGKFINAVKLQNAAKLLKPYLAP